MPYEIEATISNRSISVQINTALTTGSIGSVRCSFTFDAEWNGLIKTAIFKGVDGKSFPVLLTDTVCNVPNEVLTAGAFFNLGVMGAQDATLVIVTGWAAASLLPGCYTAISPPTEDIYLQILDAFSTSTAKVKESAQKTERYAEEIAESLPAIHADAETAKAKAGEAATAAGEAAKSRDEAKEHRDAAQASAADALASAQAAGESEENVAAMQSNVQGLSNQVAADKSDVAAKAQAIDAQAQQVQETADGFPAVADAAKEAVTAEGTKQVGLVSGEGTKQVKAVADKGIEQIAAVNEAGAIQTATAQAEADRARQQADRAQQEANRAAAIDAYTKPDSRQAFANAFVGEKSGAMVSLPDIAESTLLRKAAVQGATTEVLVNPEAEKSPDKSQVLAGLSRRSL